MSTVRAYLYIQSVWTLMRKFPRNAEQSPERQTGVYQLNSAEREKDACTKT